MMETGTNNSKISITWKREDTIFVDIWSMTLMFYDYIKFAQARRGWDSNPRSACTDNGFQDRHHRPLGHPSVTIKFYITTVLITRALGICFRYFQFLRDEG